MIQTLNPTATIELPEDFDQNEQLDIVPIAHARGRVGGREKYVPTDLARFIQSKIVQFMELRELNQVELGELINRTNQTAADLIYLRQQYTVDRLWELALAFDVPIRAFFPDEMWEDTLDSKLASKWRKLTDEQQSMAMTVINTFAKSNRK